MSTLQKLARWTKTRTELVEPCSKHLEFLSHRFLRFENLPKWRNGSMHLMELLYALEYHCRKRESEISSRISTNSTVGWVWLPNLGSLPKYRSVPWSPYQWNRGLLWLSLSESAEIRFKSMHLLGVGWRLPPLFEKMWVHSWFALPRRNAPTPLSLLCAAGSDWRVCPRYSSLPLWRVALPLFYCGES